MLNPLRAAGQCLEGGFGTVVELVDNEFDHVGVLARAWWRWNVDEAFVRRPHTARTQYLVALRGGWAAPRRLAPARDAARLGARQDLFALQLRRRH